MSGHTKGPWVAMTGYGGDAYCMVETVDVHGWEIADVRSDAPEYEANAHLIAAAPELLEALESIISHYDDFFTRDVNRIDLPWVTVARAAIAKARGQDQ